MATLLGTDETLTGWYLATTEAGHRREPAWRAESDRRLEWPRRWRDMFTRDHGGEPLRPRAASWSGYRPQSPPRPSVRWVSRRSGQPISPPSRSSSWVPAWWSSSVSPRFAGRAILVALVLSPPLVDLYATQNLLSAGARDVARFFSEGLLVVIAAILVVVSARRRTLVGAVRHPFSLAVAVFLAVSALSAVVNTVPPAAAAAMIFTLDAAVLFYLPRMVGYTHDQLHRTMWAAAIVVAIASAIAILQALLTPSLLGVTPVVGQSGEGVRMGSLVADPNILGTIIGMALPFTIFSLVRTPPGRRRWLILGAALAMGLALVLTYSRGSWIGAAIGLGGVALIIDRRAFVAFALIMVVAYGTAIVMPKGLLTGGAVWQTRCRARSTGSGPSVSCATFAPCSSPTAFRSWRTTLSWASGRANTAAPRPPSSAPPSTIGSRPIACSPTRRRSTTSGCISASKAAWPVSPPSWP